MRPRHGEDFVVARVDGCQEKALGDVADSVVLIGCDLEFCDCFRCNPPSASDFNKNSGISIDGTEDACTVPETTHFDRAHNTKEVNFNTVGQCEVLDLRGQYWERRKSRAPSCPPDDGGVAVIGGRYIFLPGTCPPPPATIAAKHRHSDADEAGAVVTPMNQSVQSKSSPTLVNNDHSSISSMDTESEILEDDDMIASPLGKLFRHLHYRPGLRYDFFLDRWTTLPARPYDVTTSFPTTCSFNGHVIVLGGYRSSTENVLSCYRHREEDSILDYEDHLDYSWWFKPSSVSSPKKKQNNETGLALAFGDGGEWTFGGGKTMFGHSQAWAHSSDMAAAVAAASALKSDDDDVRESNHDSHLNLPQGAPVPVRGAIATTYQGRLTMLGGLSTFSRTFYDSERKTIWQFFPERHEWRRAPMTLPVQALLNGYTFSLHI
ncbi:LOW QUALITY PROTEIN: hypothetical protein ACHAWF_006474 [Thalassiosira exigua]